jgi:recombinational DNA repair protein (RecF pathway)
MPSARCSACKASTADLRGATAVLPHPGPGRVRCARCERPVAEKDVIVYGDSRYCHWCAILQGRPVPHDDAAQILAAELEREAAALAAFAAHARRVREAL